VKTRMRVLVCALVLGLGAWIAGALTATSWQDEWLARFNQERARAGVRPFLPSPVLSQVAQEQAEEMTRGGLQPWPAEVISERLKRVGYSAHDWHEEDFQASSGTLEDVVASSRAALDGRFRDLGVGAAPAAGGMVYVFLFGWHQGEFFAAATARLADHAGVAAEMLARVNEVRRREGLPPYAPSPLLDRISQEHAEDMLARSYVGHRNPEGLGPTERARAAGYAAGIGENIVEDRFSAEEALAAWLDSPGHRRNVLNPGCREMGLGIAVGEGYDAAPGGYKVIWVQSVGRCN
jgi:uncharacterized protein YkwD